MARFPETEADIAALAMVVTEGLSNTPELFPAPRNLDSAVVGQHTS